MVRSKPLPSEVLDYPYTGSGTVEDPYVCEFVPDDPESPLKWMISLRWTIAMAAAGSVFVVSVCSSTYTCAEAGLAAEFGVSKSVATRGISLFLVGYIVGLMIWGLMSEVYGHRNLTVATLALLGAFNLGASESHTLPDLLTCRFLGSIFGSSPMTIASGTVVELFTAEERGVPIAIFAAGPPSWAPWWVLLLVDLRASTFGRVDQATSGPAKIDPEVHRNTDWQNTLDYLRMELRGYVAARNCQDRINPAYHLYSLPWLSKVPNQ